MLKGSQLHMPDMHNTAMIEQNKENIIKSLKKGFLLATFYIFYERFPTYNYKTQ